MGVYYKIANHTKKQLIDPEKIDGGEHKLHAIAYWDAGRVMAFAMTDEWMGDHVAVEGDADLERFAPIVDTYEDVTERMIERYNIGAKRSLVKPITLHTR